MNAPTVRVLIVEDFAEWRIELRRLVEGAPTLRVVGEAENGVEGVRRAADLAPDVVLLDLNLPFLNGIKVAQAIFASGNHPKIVFVSENRSLEIAQQAFEAGGLGYVVKSEIRRELLAAIHSALQDKRFVSDSLQPDRSSVHSRGEHPPDQEEGTVSSSYRTEFRHEVAFFEKDSDLERGFAEYAKAAIKAQKVVLLFASETHRTSISHQLSEDGIDLESLIATGRYIPLDATAALSKVMVNDTPDPVRCRGVLEDILRHIATVSEGGRPKLVVCAECAPTLLVQGKEQAAIQLERHWDEVSRAHSVDTLCGYSWYAFPDREASTVFARVCGEHTGIHKTRSVD